LRANTALSNTSFLTVESISKNFGSTKALDAVSLSLEKSNICGLAGENGAGKSTLIKILCGVHSPDAGKIHLNGEPHHPKDPNEAEDLGISVFHQEIPICPNLSVSANVFLGPNMPTRWISPDWRAMNQRCEELFETLLGEQIDPNKLIRDCNVAERQLALLVRVLSRNASLIILDEPTTALTPPEVERLFAIITRLKQQGITFIFVSHMLEELIELSDQIVVLRDGRFVRELKRNTFNSETLSQIIAGRALSGRFTHRELTQEKPVLEVKGLTLPGEMHDISFQLCKGEILGIAGLQGSGRSSIARALFGAPPAETGTILIDGEKVTINEPTDAMQNGIGYVPEDRKMLGLFDDMDIKHNLAIAGVNRYARWGFMIREKLRSMANDMKQELDIRMTDADSLITSLSGGNQQKVLIARWLALRPNILIMNEPTRGVDVGAKEEICHLILQLANKGYAFVLSSTELEEMLSLSDRILVMNKGRVVTELSRSEATKDKVILAATT
jgi:ribose transport system ATP-binding protein